MHFSKLLNYFLRKDNENSSRDEKQNICQIVNTWHLRSTVVLVFWIELDLDKCPILSVLFLTRIPNQMSKYQFQKSLLYVPLFVTFHKLYLHCSRTHRQVTPTHPLSPHPISGDQASALYVLRPSSFIKVLFQIKYYSCLFRKHFMRYYLMLNFLTICLLSSSKHQSFSDTTHKAQTSKLF